MEKLLFLCVVLPLLSVCQPKQAQEDKAKSDSQASQMSLPTENAEDTPKKQSKPTTKYQKVGMQAMVKAYFAMLGYDKVKYTFAVQDWANGYVLCNLENADINAVEIAYFLTEKGEEILACAPEHCMMACRSGLVVYRMQDNELVEATGVVKGFQNSEELGKKITEMEEKSITEEEKQLIQRGDMALYNIKIKLPQQGTTIKILKIPNRQNALPTILAEMPFNKKTGTFQLIAQ
jgi:hypothetical protein